MQCGHTSDFFVLTIPPCSSHSFFCLLPELGLNHTLALSPAIVTHKTPNLEKKGRKEREIKTNSRLYFLSYVHFLILFANGKGSGAKLLLIYDYYVWHDQGQNCHLLVTLHSIIIRFRLGINCNLIFKVK